MGRAEGVPSCSCSARGNRRQTSGEVQEGAPGERSVPLLDIPVVAGSAGLSVLGCLCCLASYWGRCVGCHV